MEIERGFTRIAEGQVHYRRNRSTKEGRPLVLIHMSPVASGFLVPLMQALGDARPLCAPDTLGNGDSCPPAGDNPGIPDFADALGRVLDAMGYGTIDLYGVRTGAMIATELAIAQPNRVNRLFIDELNVPGPAQRTGAYGEPCPPPDAAGSQLHWAFHVMKDHWIFYPWWSRDAEHRMAWDMPSPGALHDQTVEVLKAVRTFHHSYKAAMRWPRTERLPLLRVPTAVLYQPDPKAFADLRSTAAAIPGAELAELPAGDQSQDAKAKVILGWLGRE